MHVFFEDDGAFKAGTVLADNDTSLQVEAASGKRLKIKAANVLLRFADPAPGGAAGRGAGARRRDRSRISCGKSAARASSGSSISPREYFGRAPRAARSRGARAAACTRRRCISTRRARAATRRAARGAEGRAGRRRAQARAKPSEVAALGRGARWPDRLPQAIRDKLPMLLYKPDKNALEWTARRGGVRRSADQSAGAARRLRRDSVDARLSLQSLPVRGISARHGVSRLRRAAGAARLAAAPVRAFSIDDATTTEIDDAFSVRALPNGNFEIGIHIAAPALAIAARLARSMPSRATRLSTVYMPGRKITMLPDEAIARFTLAAGAPRPALSLYVETAPDGTPLAHATRARARADRRQPAPRRDRRAVRRRPAVAGRSARGPTSCARCGKLAQKLDGGARQARHRLASTTASTSTGTPRPTAGSRSCRDRADRRSTSSSPS